VPERKVAFDMVLTGRKFLGYPHKGDQRCQFVLWIDKAWNPVLARTIVWLYNLAGSRACCEHPIGEPETNIDTEFLEFSLEKSNSDLANKHLVRELKK